MANDDRPLSPHLTIYRWPITMALSILHRLTGVALSLGLVVLVLWVGHVAAGPEQYQYFRQSFASLPGQVLLVGWSLAFFYHLANGVRHLAWDVGVGFEKRQANASSWAVIAFSVAATAVFWWLLRGGPA